MDSPPGFSVFPPRSTLIGPRKRTEEKEKRVHEGKIIIKDTRETKKKSAFEELIKTTGAMGSRVGASPLVLSPKSAVKKSFQLRFPGPDGEVEVLSAGASSKREMRKVRREIDYKMLTEGSSGKGKPASTQKGFIVITLENTIEITDESTGYTESKTISKALSRHRGVIKAMFLDNDSFRPSKELKKRLGLS